MTINTKRGLFSQLIVDKEPDGKYHCPIPECTYSETTTNFHRLVKHCNIKHSICLTKFKVKKASTLHHEKLENQRKQRKKRHIPQHRIQLLTEEQWQEAILLHRSDLDGNFASVLEANGVVVVRNFLDSKDVNILKGCVRIAKLLTEMTPAPLEEYTISGGIKMINIPADNFSKDDRNFSSGADVLDSVSAQIRKMLGNQFNLVGDISILTTPFGAQKQVIHSDNILKNRYNGLIVLSESATPTIFLPKQQPDIPILERPLLNANGTISDKSLRTRLKDKYWYMWEDLQELERKMRPVCGRPLKSGDLILFEADMVHRGDTCNDNKTLLFFHASNTTSRVEEDLQFHAGLLGSMVYGENPKNPQQKNNYFEMIRRHDQSIENAIVPLIGLLGDEVQASYNEWLAKQKFTLQV